jgi:hypothetical protein
MIRHNLTTAPFSTGIMMESGDRDFLFFNVGLGSPQFRLAFKSPNVRWGSTLGDPD